MVRAMSSNGKLMAPPMVYIKGEEMTRYASQLMLDKWVAPHLDTSQWRYFDLSCVNRDDTLDKVRVVRVVRRACACGRKVTRGPPHTPSSTCVSSNAGAARCHRYATTCRDTAVVTCSS